MKARDFAQQLIYRIINPFVKLLVKLHITPNMITMIGFIINIIAAIVFIRGAEETSRNDLSSVGWGAGLILFAGLFDMLDGQVARLGNMSSKFGALFDSVMDRYSELVMFLGICYYLVANHFFISSLMAFIAMIGSMMVSYVRARSEGLGIECKEGLMQRPERIVTIGVSGLACGIVSSITGGNQRYFIDWLPFEIFETISIFTIPITVVAILANITAIKRLMNSRNQLQNN